MSDSECPADVERLIGRTVGSVDHVEMLRELHAAPDVLVSPEQLAARLHLDRATAAKILRELQVAALVRDVDGRYQYSASSSDRATIRALLGLYESRPITLVRAIQARPRPLQSFASAFRLRPKE